MAYLYRPTLQKDLYVKKDLDVQDSTTPWVPKNKINITKINVKAYTAPTGTGSTTVRIYKDKGESSQAVLCDLVLNSSTVEASTGSSFNEELDAGSKITYSITTVTSVHPGSDAIISFMYL
jgi:hypothetical protein